MKTDKILIVGLGLIGGSYAKALTRAGYDVYAIDKSLEPIVYALDMGLIKDGWNTVNEEIVKSYDFIIFALYPNTFIKWIKEYKSYLKEGSIITDVTGVKTSVVYEIEKELEGLNIDFIPSHPMAGREVCGIRNADDSIFEGANFIITPLKTNRPKNISEVEELGEILGFKKVSILSPEKHDEMIAYLSQLTHAIAITLMNENNSHNLKDYTGDSFRDLTRIANINDEMWSELFLMNKDKLLEQMDSFIKEFTELENAIRNDDVAKIKEKMKTSSIRRSYFEERK